MKADNPCLKCPERIECITRKKSFCQEEKERDEATIFKEHYERHNKLDDWEDDDKVYHDD